MRRTPASAGWGHVCLLSVPEGRGQAAGGDVNYSTGSAA